MYMRDTRLERENDTIACRLSLLKSIEAVQIKPKLYFVITRKLGDVDPTWNLHNLI